MDGMEEYILETETETDVDAVVFETDYVSPYSVEPMTEMSVDSVVDVVGKASFAGFTVAGVLLIVSLGVGAILNIVKRA